MAYNKKNYQKKVAYMQALYLKKQAEGVDTKKIRAECCHQLFIGRSTFYNYLRVPTTNNDRKLQLSLHF